MPAWSAEEIQALKDAIFKKALGKRLTAVDLGGRLEQYADASLKDLRDLLDEAEEDAAAAPRSRIFRTRHDKGL